VNIITNPRVLARELEKMLARIGWDEEGYLNIDREQEVMHRDEWAMILTTLRGRAKKPAGVSNFEQKRPKRPANNPPIRRDRYDHRGREAAQLRARGAALGKKVRKRGRGG
jgi:hypothetical protein